MRWSARFSLRQSDSVFAGNIRIFFERSEKPQRRLQKVVSEPVDRIFQIGIAGMIFLLGVNVGFFVNEYRLYPSGSLVEDFESTEYNYSTKVSLTRVGSNDTHVLFAQCSNRVNPVEINETNYNSNRIQKNCFFHLKEKPIATVGIDKKSGDSN